MSDVTAKLTEGQKRTAITAVSIVVVGVLGIAIGRASKGSAPPEPVGETPVGRPAAAGQVTGPSPGANAMSYDASLPPQVFDNVEDPTWKAGVPQRDLDRDIFTQMKNPQIKSEQMLDLFPDKPYKVRLVGSVTEHRYALVLLDLDRDGKWDEKWDLRPGQVHRMVEHDEAVGGQKEEYTMVKGKWQPH